MARKNNPTSQFSVESRKTEFRFSTSDPSRMLGKWVVRRALHTWTEDMKDADTGGTVQIERSTVLLERGTYIDADTLSSIRFWMEAGWITEVEVSNQNRQGILLAGTSLFPYKAAARIDDKKRTFLLYATSVTNAHTILVDYIELNCKGGFEITEIKQMDYCVIIIDRLKAAEARRYELDTAYLKGEISMEDFASATAGQIAKGNPDAPETDDDNQARKFYEIGAHVVFSNEKEGTFEEDHTFIVQTVSAVRANILIEKYLRDAQEERYLKSLTRTGCDFIRYDIRSFIETSKIIPVGCFIPASFSEVYHDD